MIIEGILTTIGEGGRVNISPMGPRVEPGFHELTLKPFRSSQTYKNLKAHGEAVFHVTDDVELLARAAVSEVEAELKPAARVRGWILKGACRAYELRVLRVEESTERAVFETEVLHAEVLRDFNGFNRAKHAVVEAAILATRLHLLPRERVLAKLAELEVLIQKTGGPAEERAFAFLRNFVDAAPAALPASARVRTGSRLHFGLIWPGEGGPRRFGGAGLMVESPSLAVHVERSKVFEVDGPLAERARLVASRVTGEASPGVRIRIERAPEEHSGLGTGTQLALAVARGIAELRGEAPSAHELARQTGRGLRSAIGAHGFAQGGFLVDAGHGAAESLAPIIIRAEIPPDWRFVLAAPEGQRGLSGRAEEASFRLIDSASRASAEALCHLLVMGLAPALMEADARAFGETLFEYGRRSGELFKRAQGGAFASPAVASIVEFVRGLGYPGAGQSSWGPTVFALAADAEAGARLAKRIREQFGEAAGQIVIASPLNRGATVET